MKIDQRHGNKEQGDSAQKGGERGITGKKGKGQAKEHEERTHRHGQWGGLTGGAGVGGGT